MNNLKNYLPDKVRFWLYLVFGILALTQSAALAGFAEAGVTPPAWFDVAGAVFLVVGAGFGFTAATHTTTEDRPKPVPVETEESPTTL